MPGTSLDAKYPPIICNCHKTATAFFNPHFTNEGTCSGSQAVSNVLQFQPRSVSLKARTSPLYPVLPTGGEGLR